MEASQDNVADGLAPSHTFVPNRGYLRQDGSSPQRVVDEDGEELDREDAEASDDLDDIFEDSAEEADLDADDLATSNPADLTKSYNRQRKLNQAVGDPNVPPSQYPKANPQGKGSLDKDDQIASLSRHATKLKLEDKYLGTNHGKGADSTLR